MKFNEQWLREWVDPAVTIVEIAHRLTMAGLEVDAVAAAGEALEGVRVGAIVSIAPHPQADHLTVLAIDCGDTAPVQVVCGAPNVRVGLMVPYAGPGTVLPGGQRIGVTAIGGVQSQGMLCSARELRLGDEHGGVFELPADAVPGRSLAALLGLDDVVVDIDLTPNRGDCLSVTGIAREVGVLTGTPMRAIDVPVVVAEVADVFDVQLEAPGGCPKYAGRVIRDVDAGAAPPVWMRERLRRCGIRSINAVVDVTNYVMLELGQPMHAFDFAALHGGIRVRYARPGEPLMLLDGQEFTLTSGTLVIADHERAVAMAGVMGGAGSAVEATTRHVFLESAFFDPTQLAGVARTFRLHTDASHRFERGVDFTGQERAIERATRLILDICGGRPGPVHVSQSVAQLPTRPRIRFRPERVQEVVGIDLPEAEVRGIFERLGLDVATGPGGFSVEPPPFRFDLALEADLMEEVARIYGYERVPAEIPRTRLVISNTPVHTRRAQRARRAMVAQGYHEAVTYSFIDPAQFDLVSPGVAPHVLANPIASDMSAMRASQWPGLLQAARYNLNRRQADVRLFELGMVFERDPTGIRQHNRLAAVAVGAAAPEQWGEAARPVDFFDVKHDLEVVLAALDAKPAAVSAQRHPALHPGKSAVIEIDGKTIGFIGVLHPRLVQLLEFESAPLLFEIECDNLPLRPEPCFRPISKFPSVRRDLSIVVDGSVPAREVLESVRRAAGDLLRHLQLFDVYRGQGIDSDKKSLAMGLIFQADSSTLIDDVVETVMARVLEQLQHDVGGMIRE